MALGFYINNKNCYGCKTCSIACKSEKQLSEGVLLRTVTKIPQDNPRAVSFVSMACNHCEEPICAANCPVGAYTKLDNGIVQQNHDICIGCQTCVQLCPYGAPSYDEAEGKAHKCDLCIGRQELNLLPACVASCPGANLAYGDMVDLETTYAGSIVGNDSQAVRPNFVITKDPLLTGNPDTYALREA
jgi:Fe-S-cluster-containing dehydrogenase component